MTTVHVINIKSNGSDKAVFLNGQYILSADPGAGDDLEVVNCVARSLSSIHRAEINYLNIFPEENWSWNDELFSASLKAAQNPNIETSFDIKSSVLFEDYLSKAVDAVNYAAQQANVSPKGFSIDSAFSDWGEIEIFNVVDLIDECAAHFGGYDSGNYKYVVNALCEEVTSKFNRN